MLQRELIELQARYPDCAAEFAQLVRCIEQHEALRRQRLPGASLQADACGEAAPLTGGGGYGGLPPAGVLIVQLNEALKRATDAQEKSEQALAIRMGRLLAMAQKAGIEAEFRRILSGAPLPAEPPSYTQLVSALRFRAERAERDLAHYVEKAEALTHELAALSATFFEATRSIEATRGLRTSPSAAHPEGGPYPAAEGG